MKRRQFLKALPLVGLGAAGIAAARYWLEQGFMNRYLGTLPDAVTNHPFMQTVWHSSICCDWTAEVFRPPYSKPQVSSRPR